MINKFMYFSELIHGMGGALWLAKKREVAMSTRPSKLIAAVLIFALAAAPAHAEMIGSEGAMPERERIAALLERPDTRAALEARGVDPEVAKARVAALSDAEVNELARAIDAAPAGKGGTNPLAIIALPLILAALAVALVVTAIGGLFKLARAS